MAATKRFRAAHIFLAFAVIGFSVPAFSSFAATGKFCAGVASYSAKVQSQIADSEAKGSQRQIERESAVASATSAADTKKHANWTAQDAALKRSFAAIMKRAKTPAEKTAAQDFETAVTKAITDRRAVVTDATAAFQAGVKNFIDARTASMVSAVGNYKTNVASAIAAAKVSCAAGGTSDAAVKNTFNKSLAAAKKQFESDRASIGKLNASLNSLAETRRDAVSKANDDFKAAVTKARADLKSAAPNL